MCNKWFLISISFLVIFLFSCPSGLKTSDAKNVNFDGLLVSGKSVTGKYELSDKSTKGKATFRWLKAPSINGKFIAIKNATQITYPITVEDVDSFIKFEVTLFDEAGKKVNSFSSSAKGPILANAAPTALSLFVAGDTKPGIEVAAKYSYVDDNKDEEGASIITWELSTAEAGPFSVIEGETKNKYTIKNADEKKYIRFSIIPVAKSGTISGVKVTSITYGPIDMANLTPVSKNITINGFLKEGKTVKIYYEYFDREGDVEGASTFQWLTSATVDGDYSELAGATAVELDLTSDQVGKFIKIKIIAVDNKNASGDPMLSMPVGPVVDSTSVSTFTYPSVLKEATSNDGKLESPVFTIQLDGGTFDDIQVTHFILNNLPAGFSFAVVPNPLDNRDAIFTLIGAATAHGALDSIANLSVTILPAAFSSTQSFTSSPIRISFNDL